MPETAYPVFITSNEVLAGFPAKPVLVLPPASERAQSGVGAQNKDSIHKALVLPLAREMARRTCNVDGKIAPIAVVHVDREMQYRVLIEVLFTLSKLGYEQLYLATRQEPTNGGPSRFRGVRFRARESAPLQLVVRQTGMWLLNERGIAFDRDCWELPAQSKAPALTLTEAQRCVSTRAGTDGALHLAVEGDVPVRAVIPLLSAFGAQRPVTPVFPLVSARPAASANEAASDAKPPMYSVGNASVVVSGLRGAFRRCYQQELSQRRDAAGTVNLTIHVDAAGHVSGASVVVSGNLQTSGECVRQTAMSAQFAPPEGGHAVISVPVTFLHDTDADLPKLPCVRAQTL